MGFWDWVAPATPQTVSDDARSRVARRQQFERDRLQRVEHDPDTGKPLLWFTITVSSMGNHQWVPIDWPGQDAADARASFIEWLKSDEFITVDFMNNGAESELTFRSAWVAGWTMDKKGRTRR